MEPDLTYLSKLYSNNTSEFNYLLCIIDHFSKFAKTYLLKSKESSEVLKYIKLYITEFGSPHIIQSDNGGEFTAKIIKNYLKEQKILFINPLSFSFMEPRENRLDIFSWTNPIVNKRV